MTALNWVHQSDQTFIRKAMQAPFLERAHELDLARRWQATKDEKALSELINAYLRLVIKTASRFRRYGLASNDLIQEGIIGLLEAAKRFEPERELRFSTYASWWIKAAMQDFILRNWSIVRAGTTTAHKALFFNLHRMKAQLGLASDKALSLEGRAAIAQISQTRPQDIDFMDARLAGGDYSLQAPLNDSETGDDWQSLLASTSPDPFEVVEAKIDQERQNNWITHGLNSLSKREAYIIRARYLSEESATLSALGEKLNISKERVRQIEAVAMARLKAALLARSSPDLF